MLLICLYMMQSTDCTHTNHFWQKKEWVLLKIPCKTFSWIRDPHCSPKSLMGMPLAMETSMSLLEINPIGCQYPLAHRGFKWQKPAKNYIWRFVKLSGSDLCLQQFDKFLKCSECNCRKRKLCKSVELDFGKIRESTSGELIFGGFKSFGTTVVSLSIAAISTSYLCILRIS